MPVRTTILNGTPVTQGNVLDLWSQFTVLDPAMILNEHDGTPMSFTQFRAKYCQLALAYGRGRHYLEVVGNNDDAISVLKKKVKPWILRRMNTDLPPIIYTHREVELSSNEWKAYCDMRDYLVAWFLDNPSQAPNGAVKTMRLAQITSGFLGGLTELQGTIGEDFTTIKEIGKSKEDAFIEWLDSIESNTQIIVWCRFRAELQRLYTRLTGMGEKCGLVFGGQNDKDRQWSINCFQTGTNRFVLGNAQAGGFGLNLPTAAYEIYLSNDFNYLTRDQSELRAQRKGRKESLQIIDFLARGPNDELTFDYEILAALKQKETFHYWTAEEWVKKLGS